MLIAFTGDRTNICYYTVSTSDKKPLSPRPFFLLFIFYFIFIINKVIFLLMIFVFKVKKRW